MALGHWLKDYIGPHSGGSGGGGGETIRAIINEDYTVETLNKTVDEIVQMLSNGSSPFVVDIGSDYHSPKPFYNVGYINEITFNDRTGGYNVNVSGQEGGLTYTSASWNDYPSRTPE